MKLYMKTGSLKSLFKLQLCCGEDWCHYEREILEHIEKDWNPCAWTKDHAKMQGDASNLQAKETGLRRSQSCCQLCLRILVSKTIRK